MFGRKFRFPMQKNSGEQCANYSHEQSNWFYYCNSQYSTLVKRPKVLFTIGGSISHANCCDIGQTCIGKDVKMTYYSE